MDDRFQEFDDAEAAVLAEHDECQRRVLLEVARERLSRLRTPYFPVAVSPAEDLTLYRHSVQRLARAWVFTQFEQYGTQRISEDRALRACERIAGEEIGRELHDVEKRILGEAVRDVLTAYTIMAQMEAEGRPEVTDTAARLHSPRRLFGGAA